jgi:hypothetical protein
MMDYSLSQLGSFDQFFYYGKADLDYENKSDALQLALQPKRTMYYNNDFGCGIANKRNFPNVIGLQILLKFEIATAFAQRNTVVTDGTNDTRDRRLAVSQTSIGFEQNGGEMNCNIYYIQYYNYQKGTITKMPMGIAK